MRALQSRSSQADRVVGSGVVKRVVQVSRATAAGSEDGGNGSRMGNGEFPGLQAKLGVVARSSCGETRFSWWYVSPARSKTTGKVVVGKEGRKGRRQGTRARSLGV